MNRLRISCSSLFLWEYPVHDIMDILRKSGINSVEFWAETPFFWMKRNEEAAIAELKRSISSMPDGCTMHAPVMDLNPSSYNYLVHEATIKETLWSMDLARTIGARVLTVHPGKRTAHRRPTNEDWEKLMKYLKISIEKANRLGIDLSLENSMPGVQSMCSNPDEMREVLDQVPGLFFTFDVVHAFLESPKTILSFVDEFGDKLKNVHIGAPHNGKPHYPVRYEKKIDAVLQRLSDSGYEGDLTIEIDDKVYPGPLSRDDKIRELVSERKHIESVFSI